ncbi:MAG TPA: hypothetical protein VGL29_24765 [Blastocatellia bacterium]
MSELEGPKGYQSMYSPRRRRLGSCLSAVRRRKLALLAPALVLAVAAGAAVRKLPNRYESSAKVKVGGERESSKRLGQVRQRITDPDSLARIREWLPSNGQTLDDFIAQAREDISVELDASPDLTQTVFTVSYRSTDPEAARRITEELADQIIAQSSTERPQEDAELERLNAQANEILRRVRALEETSPWLPGVRDGTIVSQSARSAPISAEAARAQEMTIESIKDQQYKLKQQLADVERRIGEQRLIVEQQKKGSGLRDNPTYAALLARRAELQGQRDTLINRQELTDRHPRVLAINDQIAAIDRQIEELRRQDAASLAQSPEARELSALERERNRLRLDLEVTQRELARQSTLKEPAALEKSPARRGASASKLANQYLDLKRAYSDVKNQIQAARSSNLRAPGEIDEQARLVAQASLPRRPISPNRPLLIFLAAAVGLAFGGAFTIFAESRRLKSLQDAGDVERYVRLPVLASIPRTTTAGESKRARWRAMGRLALGTAISMAATVALGKLFIISNLFVLITRR